MNTMKRTLIFILLSLIITQGFSQVPVTKEPIYKSFNRFYAGINGGGMVTFSNIKEKDYMPTDGELKFGGGAIIGYQISPILGLQGQFIYGDVAGKKDLWLDKSIANRKFNTNVMEFGFNATISLSKWWAPRLKLNKKLDFYGLVGFGLVAFRSKLYTLDQGIFITAIGYSSDGTTKQARTIEAVYPVGLGVKYKINEKWNIGIETNLRNMNTDKFDAFVRKYNPKDKYSYTFIGIQYIFGKKERALEWVDMIEYEKMRDPVTPDTLLLQKIDSLGKEIAELKNRKVDSIASLKVAPVENKVNILEGKTTDISFKVDSLMCDKKASFGSVLPSVYFETGSYTVSKQNFKNLAAVALYMKTNPTARLTVVAHTDKRDKDNVNTKLANNRAKSVLNMLSKEYNIDKSRIDIQIKVSKDPLSNKNDAINRRVDFMINNK
jgi:OmpA-OmpF porin, OOP family